MISSEGFLSALVAVTLTLLPSSSLAQPAVTIPPGGPIFSAVPDLVIASVAISGKYCPNVGQGAVMGWLAGAATVTVKIRNDGPAAAVMPEPLAWAPWVAVWDVNSAEPNQAFWFPPPTRGVKFIASGAPAQLLPGKTATFKVSLNVWEWWSKWPPGQSSEFRIGVQVDPNNRIIESNEDNNLKRYSAYLTQSCS
jgi:hypothetical protein